MHAVMLSSEHVSILESKAIKIFILETKMRLSAKV